MSFNRIDKILDKIEEETRKEKINNSLTSLKYYNGGIHMQGKEEQKLFLEDVLSITHKKWFVNSFIEKSLKIFVFLVSYTLCIQKPCLTFVFIEQNGCFVQCITGCIV